MVWQIAAAAGINAIGSLIGAGAQNNAAKDAARAQADAANRQVDLYRDIYDDQRHLQMPYYQMGLQAMYGPSGLGNLLGVTQPGGGGQAPSGGAPQPSGQPANAFSDYASGSYGMETPAQQSDNKWRAYLTANPDIQNAFQSQNIANSPHLLGGGGKGADLDGNGSISDLEYAQWHYNTMGQNEGRSFGDYGSKVSPDAPLGGPNVVANGDGSYGQGGDQPVGPVAAEPGTGSEPIGSMTSTLRQTPGYQFLQDESKRQIEGSFASRGKLMSGAAMNALNDRTLGIADNTYQQAVNNQFNLANLGMGSAAQIQSAGNNFAAGAGNAYGNMGAAQAQGAYGRANAFNMGLQGVGNAVNSGVGAYGSYKDWW